ncbi:2-phosphosulfolactate phosphatase [Paenibacillus cisolokensis]|uniref:2-phosphosulfolactate phosphatase n=1 Tax=Paenibacillus cisolokensis TaxID=1658519 RepID=UPI003D2DB022
MAVSIIQGSSRVPGSSDIHVVIDVIRAFTVAHYAFLNGVKGILLAPSLEQAFRYKQEHPDYLLAGEVGGLPIPGFDLDNSPKRLDHSDVAGKYLIQKTTNGVQATLQALHAKQVLVTGFSNARTTARYVRQQCMTRRDDPSVVIVASHPTGDDDLACAFYMKGIIEGTNEQTAAQTIARIRASEAAKKFYDPKRPEFDDADIGYCVQELNSDFVMNVSLDNHIPTIERLQA